MLDINKCRLQPASGEDAEFLYQVYVSTREIEMALTGWPPENIEKFLRFQFNLQDTQYRRNYPDAEFSVIYLDRQRVGRLYINQTDKEIRIIDISLLSEFRHRGLGTYILQGIIAQADAAGLPMRLSVGFDNPARNLYKKLGFTVTNDSGVYLAMERTALVPLKGSGRLNS